MFQVTEISCATFFRTRERANKAAHSCIHRDEYPYKKLRYGRVFKHGSKYEVKYEKLSNRRKGFVVYYPTAECWLCVRQRITLYGIHIKKYNKTTVKQKLYYQDKEDYENVSHPLFGMRRQKLKPYILQHDIPIPNTLINKGAVGINNSLDRGKLPFNFMEVGDSFFAPNTSVRYLMKSLRNWRFKNKNKDRHEYEEDKNGEIKLIRKEFIASEEYDDNELFLGSRMWCIRKDYIDV